MVPVIWGHDIYGKVDKVPGFFSIGTKFFHIYYVPLFPTASYVILKQRGKQFSGVQIPLRFKSVLIGYGQGLLAAPWVFAGLVAFIVGVAPNAQLFSPRIPLIIAAVTFSLWAMFMLVSFFSKASYKRACQLGVIAGLNEAGWEQLNAHFGRAGTLPQATP